MAQATVNPPPDAMPTAIDRWHDICALCAMVPGTAVAALIDGQQVAVVRTLLGTVHALGHYDPTSRAMVLARGIVGDHGGIPVIVSPITKAAFDLTSGVCLDRPEHRVPLHQARVRAERIEVRLWSGLAQGGAA